MSFEGRIYTLSTCAICDRGRRQVAALVELRPGRCVCSECAEAAVTALVDHYGDVSPFFPADAAPPAVVA